MLSVVEIVIRMISVQGVWCATKEMGQIRFLGVLIQALLTGTTVFNQQLLCKVRNVLQAVHVLSVLEIVMLIMSVDRI